MKLGRREFTAAALGAAACSQNKQKTVMVVPKGTSHMFWVTVRAGAEAAGKDFSLNVVWNGPNQETDYARQIQIVNSAIAQRVDGLVLAASDRKALVQYVDKAVEAGIPVTIFDSGLDSGNFLSWVATNNVQAGEMGGRELGRLLGGKGKVAVIQHVPGSVSTMDREAGFESVIAKEFPGIQIVQKLYGMSDRAKAMAAAENILTAHPDLNGMFASTEPSASGLLLAVKARNLGGKLKVVGFDANDAMIEELRAGNLDAMVVQDPYKIGYEAVRTVADKLAGKQPPKRMDLEAVVVSKANLDTAPIQQLLKPPVRQ
ncbi:MAG: substrate-binding domain-containing protein [Acidobacteria bacterium]|nr:substrate-binding domain-containing protein [Acidobacteriota bacterium]